VLVSSILSQEIGSRERLRKDLLCVEWVVKPQHSKDFTAWFSAWHIEMCQALIEPLTWSPSADLSLSGGDHTIQGHRWIIAGHPSPEKALTITVIVGRGYRPLPRYVLSWQWCICC